MKDLNVPHIQFGYVYEISDGDEDFIRDLFYTFLQKIPEDLTKIANAFNQKVWCEVGKVAHKMRSSALFLGANQLGEAAELLELHCTHLEIQPQKIEEIISLLEKCFRQVEEEINVWLSDRA